MDILFLLTKKQNVHAIKEQVLEMSLLEKPEPRFLPIACQRKRILKMHLFLILFRTRTT